MFDLKLENITAWIRNGGYSSVALQLPEGLKIRATEIVDFISERTDVSVTVLGDPCYGACDLFTDNKDVADALVHFGHSPIPSQGDDPDVLYIEAFYDADVTEYVREHASELGDSIGLLATVQYIGCIDQAKKALESCGKKAFVGVGDRRITYPGQVLGCNCSSAESIADDVDEYLFIGEGDFHPLAAAFGMGKKIRVLNPITGELRDVDEVRDRILRKRFAAIQSAADAKTFLIVVCSKIGQRRDGVAKDIASKIESAGRTAYIAYMNELSPQSLMSYRVDAYVSTACPRLAMDDYARYPKPILTPIEAEIAVGLRTWDDYAFDVIRP
jgi:2-(3-amino-3-carboxypropyl)histidine synthase